MLEEAVLGVTVLLVIVSLVNAVSLSFLWKKKDTNRGKRIGPGELEFVVVSKASRSVINTLLETLRRVREGFPEYRVWVVVDEGSYGIPLLKRLSREIGLELVVVPSWYDKGRFKARAINYFIETFVDEGKWYVFLDDDSYPLDDRFLYEIREDIPVYNGILVPRRGKGLLPWLADSVRYYSDVSRARFALETLRKPIYGLHGELLIVKGWVLREIGFNTDSITEDSWFAARLVEKGIPVGQVSTRVSVQSPHTIEDFMVQRARWFLGRLRDFLRLEYPGIMMATHALELLLMLLFPAVHIVVFLKIAYGIEFRGALALIEAWIRYAGLPMLIAAYTLYHVAERRSPLTALAAILLLPIITLIEAHTVTYAVANFRRLYNNFAVINKDLEYQILAEKPDLEPWESPLETPWPSPRERPLPSLFSMAIAGDPAPWLLEGGVKPWIKIGLHSYSLNSLA